jgi:hypothetical protein
MKILRLFWCLLPIFLAYSLHVHALEEVTHLKIERLLSRMSAQEKDILEEFWERLITHYHFGYVLFGNKPMATCSIAEHIDVLYIFSEDALRNQRMQKGWNVWQKQCQILESDRFVLRLTKNSLCPSMNMLVLINRELALECISKNITLFRKALGEKIDPDKILFDLETKNSILQDALNNHEELFGILLGYGTHNALMYVKTKPWNRHCPVSSNIACSFVLASNPLPVRLTPFNPSIPSHLLFIDLPRFGVDAHHLETINLKHSYHKTMCELDSFFLQRNFLSTILNQWIGDAVQ